LKTVCKIWDEENSWRIVYGIMCIMFHTRLKIIAVMAGLFLSTSAAHAIPPPDALISVWQSVLQMLGVASVFIVGAYFSVKQFFSAYFAGWTRSTFVLAGLGLVMPLVLWFAYDNMQKPAGFVPPTTMEYISIEESIERDPDEDVREWKLKTFKEMQQEVDFARGLKNLPKLTYKTLPSFTPQTLNKEMQADRGNFYLLDVREAYERSKFYMQYDSSVRYGDILHGIITPDMASSLPKDKQIVVLCHSGLRGYIAANLLANLGYKNIAFLQGGLRNWSEQQLPITGDEGYSSEPVSKPIYTKSMIKEATNTLKVNIEASEIEPSDIPDVIHLPFEIATTADIQNIVEQSKTKPIIIICSSFIACFHSNSFNYLVEKSGGKVIGIHDTTDEFLIPPIIIDD